MKIIISKKKLKFLFFFLLLLILVLEANLTLAVRERWRPPEIEYPPVPFLNAERPNDFIQKIRDEVPGYTPEKALSLYVRYFYGLFLMLSGFIAFGAIVVGGFFYLISSGNPVQMVRARQQITAGILGLVFLLSSYLILTTLNPQLAIFPSLTLTKVTLPTIEVPEIKPGEATLLFQVPTGRIVERAVLDSEGRAKLEMYKRIAREIKEEAKKLKDMAEELKNLTDACTCGGSICSGPSACSGIGCDSTCDINAINTKKDEIQTQITALKNKEPQILVARQSLINDYVEFQKAGLLMSVPLQVMDYNSMLGYRYFGEQMGQKFQIVTDGFPKWDDNKIIIAGEKIVDPATFYFDKRKSGNEQAIQWALTSPFLNSPFPTGPGPYPIPGTTDPQPFQPPGSTPSNIVDIAKLVSSRTGFRAAFILGLTKSESGWNPYAGVPYTRERICTCKSSYMDWRVVVCQILEEQIAPELNLDPFNPDQVRVSLGSATAGCGGAMGAGQIMPFTWIGIKTRISEITGNYPPSPWSLIDGFVATGVVLLDKYNARIPAFVNPGPETGPLNSCTTEKRLVYKYFGCDPDNLSWCPSPWYGDRVVQVSEQIATNENLGHCVP